MTSILIVDDERGMCESLSMLLRMEGFDVDFTTSPRDAIERLARRQPDVIVTDMRMPELNGVELLEAIKSRSPLTEVIVMTAYATVDSAVTTMKIGAFDYIMKPFKNDAILDKIRRAARNAISDQRLMIAPEAGSGGGEGLVAESAQMRDVLALARRLSGTDMTVLVTGETGTGKSAIARCIHSSSRRSKGRFVAVNCSTLPESLAESELFGHVKGAFTGAVSTRKGLFQEAAGGTIFLDEIALLPLSQQPKLLLALEERVVRPVGASQSIPVDVRVIAATNTNLAERVRDGAFRQDLFYRLNAATIQIPPLRERADDLPELCRCLLQRQRQRGGRDLAVSEEALELLRRYSFPGNVRELDNVVHWAAAVAAGKTIQPLDLPKAILSSAPAWRELQMAGAEPRTARLADVTRQTILDSIARNGGNLAQAAKELGIGRTTLWRRMKEYGVGHL